MFGEAFGKMGVSDETVKGKLLRSIAKESDFGTLLVSTERGDLADFGVKCGEMAANALIKHLDLEKALMNKIAAKGAAAAATGLVKGALAVKDGDYTGAAKELSSAFIGYFPAGRAYQAAVEVIDASIASWKDYEFDEAYRNYIKDAGDSTAVSDDDWNTMCTAQLRGYLIRLQDEAKSRYCEVNGISRGKLDEDKTLSGRIENQAAADLRKIFERRLSGEQKIRENEAACGKIIEGFRRDLLLERGAFRFDVDMDIEDRLRTLFAARQNILDLFDGKMPVLKSGESAEANLNEAIAKWITLGPKKRGEFYKWLEQKGYKSKVKLAGGGFAWVRAGTVTYDRKKEIEEANKNRAGVYSYSAASSEGSYSYTWTYVGKGDTYYDPDLLHGENSTSKCTWTVPPTTIQGGETVTLSLELSFGSQELSFYSDNAGASADFDKWDVDPVSSRGALFGSKTRTRKIISK